MLGAKPRLCRMAAGAFEFASGGRILNAEL